jgi:hypothetical protein
VLVGTIERDPAGLLARVPELARLAQLHPSLARAIERGKPHAVYRALFWLKLLGKTERETELVTQLLATRRLFLQPLNGAPTMMTYNGVGARPYGESEVDRGDGTFIMTLYLVVVFVPLYPFSSYLVRGADSGSGWTFFGKVPLSPVHYFWQRALALAGVVAVAFGIFNAVGAARYNMVQVVNALHAPVDVQVGAGRVTVGPGSIAKLRSRIGVQDVVVRLGGQEIERGKLEVKRGFDVNAWNVLGTAALYRQDVTYTASGVTPPAPSTDGPDFWCGEQQVLEEDVDFAFSEPPQSIQMGKSETTSHRSYVDLAKVPAIFCVFELHKRNESAKAKLLGQKLAQVSNYELEIVARLASWLNAEGDDQAALTLVETGRRAHDAELEYHRLYQGIALSAAQRARMIEEYRARAKVQPDSADSAYLLGRVLTGTEADQFVSEARRRFPQHAPLLRSQAFRALLHDDYAAVELAVEALRSVAPKVWQETVSLELRALAASGKVAEARKLVSDCLTSEGLDDENRFEYAVAARQLSRLEPPIDAPDLAAVLHGSDEKETATLRLTARVLAGDTVDAEELRRIDDERARGRLELELLVHSDPKAALSRVVNGAETSPGLEPASWALLLCEAARLDEQAALRRLLRWTPIGRAGAEALVAYVRTGTTSPELEDVGWETRAAADYARSRSLPVNSPETEALRGRAARQDALHGVVTLAMNAWPP